LALQQANHADGGKYIGYVAMAKLLTGWRNSHETAWLKDAPVHPLQHSLKDLERAYRNFFEKHADFPRFKKKWQSDSFRYPDPKQIKLDQTNNRIFLPKLGWLRYRNSREVLGELRNVTISQSGGKWFVAIQTQREVEKSVHPAHSIVGIDVGIARFATLSDGTYIEPINSFKQLQTALAREQREMSRKVKFSCNWKKAKAKVAKLHQRIARVRQDFLHKTSTAISKNHAMVVIEDLKVSNMSRSASGTREAPSCNIKAKSGLNKSILDQGWGEFRRQLEYKQAWLGGEVLAIPPQYTSQKCSYCGMSSPKSRKTQEKYSCVFCGFEINADWNAARNILAAGHAVLACGELVHQCRSVKQEPTEGITQNIA